MVTHRRSILHAMLDSFCWRKLRPFGSAMIPLSSIFPSSSRFRFRCSDRLCRSPINQHFSRISGLDGFPTFAAEFPFVLVFRIRIRRFFASKGECVLSFTSLGRMLMSKRLDHRCHQDPFTVKTQRFFFRRIHVGSRLGFPFFVPSLSSTISELLF